MGQEQEQPTPQPSEPTEEEKALAIELTRKLGKELEGVSLEIGLSVLISLACQAAIHMNMPPRNFAAIMARMFAQVHLDHQLMKGLKN